jgi:ethanolamine utilization protein EutQ (cupin superfamily)
MWVGTTESCALGLRTGKRLRQSVASALSSQQLTRELLRKTTTSGESYSDGGKSCHKKTQDHKMCGLVVFEFDWVDQEFAGAFQGG